MARIFTAIGVATAAVLASCSSLPACGTPEAYGRSCTSGWAGTMTDGNPYSPQSNYTAKPVTLAPPAVQAPAVASDGAQYQTIMVNTPDGVVAKHCKVLNGQVVDCS